VQVKGFGLSSKTDANMSSVRVPVWDVFVRVFHWSLAAAVLIDWFTQGNRVKNSSGNEAYQKLVVPCGHFASEA
jgi:cytochrome b